MRRWHQKKKTGQRGSLHSQKLTYVFSFLYFFFKNRPKGASPHSQTSPPTQTTSRSTVFFFVFFFTKIGRRGLLRILKQAPRLRLPREDGIFFSLLRKQPLTRTTSRSSVCMSFFLVFFSLLFTAFRNKLPDSDSRSPVWCV